MLVSICCVPRSKVLATIVDQPTNRDEWASPFEGSLAHKALSSNSRHPLSLTTTNLRGPGHHLVERGKLSPSHVNLLAPTPHDDLLFWNTAKMVLLDPVRGIPNPTGLSCSVYNTVLHTVFILLRLVGSIQDCKHFAAGCTYWNFTYT